jgi:hypothetical protein
MAAAAVLAAVVTAEVGMVPVDAAEIAVAETAAATIDIRESIRVIRVRVDDPDICYSEKRKIIFFTIIE